MDDRLLSAPRVVSRKVSPSRRMSILTRRRGLRVTTFLTEWENIRFELLSPDQPPKYPRHDREPNEDRGEPEQEAPPRAREPPPLAPVALNADRPDAYASLGQRGAVTADGLVAGCTWAGSRCAAVDAARTGIVVHVLELVAHLELVCWAKAVR
jgi:hypothetical protein